MYPCERIREIQRDHGIPCLLERLVLKEAFGTYDLPLQDWLLVVGLAFSVVPVLELTKWLIRRFVPLEQVRELHPNRVRE